MPRGRPRSASQTLSGGEKKPPVKKKGPHLVDRHVGLRVRQRRTVLGLSQQSLAAHLGMSFQQVQKYESGMNRISASRLLTLAQLLQADVGYFFDGLPSDPHQATLGEAEAASGAVHLDWHKRETLELVRAFCGITDPAIREQLISLIASCGQGLVDRELTMP